MVVADNLSCDGTVELAAGLAPDATIVRVGRNAGYGAGINAGIATAKPSDAVLILNPDVRLEPGSVGRLAAALDEPGTGIASPGFSGPTAGSSCRCAASPDCCALWARRSSAGERALGRPR